MKICLFDRIGNWPCLTVTGKKFMFAFFPRWDVLIHYVFGPRISPDKAYCWYIGPMSLIIWVDKSKRECGKEVDHYYFGKSNDRR